MDIAIDVCEPKPGCEGAKPEACAKPKSDDHLINEIPEFFKIGARFIDIKSQSVEMAARIVSAKLSEKTKELNKNTEIEKLNVQFLREIEEKLNAANNEMQDLTESLELVKDEYISLKKLYFEKKENIDIADKNVVKTAELCISSQTILEELDETILLTIPRKEQLRSDIRNAFTAQSPLRLESDAITQNLRKTDKILVQVTVEKSELEGKLAQHRSQLRGNMLGLTTDETSARSTALRLQQYKTELTNLQNRLAETISLCHEQSGLAMRFHSEINKMKEEINNLSSQIAEQSSHFNLLQNEKRKLDEYSGALDNRLNVIFNDQELLNKKLEKNMTRCEEMRNTHDLRTLQITTYANSVREKGSKLENKISTMTAELRVVHARNVESSRLASAMKRRLPKQQYPSTAVISSRSHLFPSK